MCNMSSSRRYTHSPSAHLKVRCSFIATTPVQANDSLAWPSGSCWGRTIFLWLWEWTLPVHRAGWKYQGVHVPTSSHRLIRSGSFWINTPASSAFDGTTERHVLHVELEPWPSMVGTDSLTHLLGFPLFPVSLPHYASWHSSQTVCAQMLASGSTFGGI